MDPNPFDEKESKAESTDRNAPIALPSDEPGQQGQGVTVAKSDRVLWYTIGGIAISACVVMILLVFTFYKSAQTQVNEVFAPVTPFPTYTPRPAITPNLTATQRAWIPPRESPTFGTSEQAKQAAEEHKIYPLMAFAAEQPAMPDINQPGDIYIYQVDLSSDTKALWDYGWCARTQQLLEQNFAQMKVEFVMNRKAVTETLVAVTENQPQDDRYCRWLTTLIEYWPPGQHQLEVRVTFLIPTDDGWNVYPAGTHTFKYFVNVKD